MNRTILNSSAYMSRTICRISFYPLRKKTRRAAQLHQIVHAFSPRLPGMRRLYCHTRGFDFSFSIFVNACHRRCQVQMSGYCEECGDHVGHSRYGLDSPSFIHREKNNGAVHSGILAHPFNPPSHTKKPRCAAHSFSFFSASSLACAEKADLQRVQPCGTAIFYRIIHSVRRFIRRICAIRLHLQASQLLTERRQEQHLHRQRVQDIRQVWQYNKDRRCRLKV